MLAEVMVIEVDMENGTSVRQRGTQESGVAGVPEWDGLLILDLNSPLPCGEELEAGRDSGGS